VVLRAETQFQTDNASVPDYVDRKPIAAKEKISCGFAG